MDKPPTTLVGASPTRLIDLAGTACVDVVLFLGIRHHGIVSYTNVEVAELGQQLTHIRRTVVHTRAALDGRAPALDRVGPAFDQQRSQ